MRLGIASRPIVTVSVPVYSVLFSSELWCVQGLQKLVHLHVYHSQLYQKPTSIQCLYRKKKLYQHQTKTLSDLKENSTSN